MPNPVSGASTGVTITNPLVLYRSLLARKQLTPDPAQHRLAIHLQKLYFRLKDYEPEVAYSTRLRHISRALGPKKRSAETEDDCPREDTSSRGGKGLLAWLRAQQSRQQTMAMTRVMTSREAALSLDSPQGLLLHGEVGTGKSMLVDLLADSLPNRKKSRWHFNTFMLDTLRRVEELRCEHLDPRNESNSVERMEEEEYSMLRLARDLLYSSPILFLDEFQLPDRAASKILSNLLTAFFQLGGVLVATSNRMPEELSKASGVEFTPPPARYGLRSFNLRSLWGLSGNPKGEVFAGQGEFAGFLEVLKARCEVWNMEGRQDYRRLEAEQGVGPEFESRDFFESQQAMRDSSESLIADSKDSSGSEKPRNYFLIQEDDIVKAEDKAWTAAVMEAIGHLPSSGPLDMSSQWKPSTVSVYGRTIPITRTYQGVTQWSFDELCGHRHGPADYISLASAYHTLILTDVPVLTVLEKNEARRFITLLDALYEARCKLLVRAHAAPDDLFFPESRRQKPGSKAMEEPSSSEEIAADATYAETISEVEQDLTMPFRPNITAYDSNEGPVDGSPHRSVLADEDSDFGPLESRSDPQLSRDERSTSASGSSFTGEDEMFAFKRARSRLYELCGAKWWARGSAAESGTWWKPLPESSRPWERRLSASQTHSSGAKQVEEFPHGASPFRRSPNPPPKFSWVHAWGMMKWGKKAGQWGRGVDAYDGNPASKKEQEHENADHKR